MVSLPSERTMARVRLKQKRGSGAAAFVELFTQFQSFGASLVYNTYGRTIANNIAGESGIRVLDQFNPLVRMSWALRNKNYECLANAFITVGVAMTLVDSTVEMLTGRIEKPIKEDGTINKDLLFKRTVAPLGIGGVFLDSIWEAVEGTGQGAGGIAWHAFPALSRITRTVSNLKRPLESKSVENKGQAFAAAFGQELASMAGLKSFPVVALVYQAAIGSWLDMLIKGGPEDYKEMIRGRERRGLEVFEWERNPKPGNFPALLGL